MRWRECWMLLRLRLLRLTILRLRLRRQWSQHGAEREVVRRQRRFALVNRRRAEHANRLELKISQPHEHAIVARLEFA